MLNIMEMVKRDLEAQDVPEDEIRAAMDRLMEDANWRMFLAGAGRVFRPRENEGAKITMPGIRHGEDCKESR